MRRIINDLKLVRMMYSPTMVRELLFGIEIMLTVLFLTVAILPVSHDLIFVAEVGGAFGHGGDDLIFYSPSYDAADILYPDDIAISHPEIGTVYRNAFTHVLIDKGEDGLGTNAVLVSYDEKMYRDFCSGIKLSDGKFANTPESGTLPLVIGSALSERYRIGDTLEITYNSSGTGGIVATPGAGERFDDVTVRCTVTGVLSSDSIVPAVTVTGGQPDDISYAALDMSYLESNDRLYIIAPHIAELLPHINYDGAALFRTSGDADGLVSKLEDEYGDLGRFATVGEIRKTTVKESLHDSEWTLLLLLLFVIVVVSGCVCYIIISVSRGQRRAAILHICGLSFGRSVLVSAAAMLLLTVPSAAAGLLLSPLIISAAGAGQFAYYGYNISFFGVIAALFAAASLAGVATAFFRRRGVSAADLYREG